MQSILRRVFPSVFLMVLASSAFAQTRTITTVAGNGTAGYSGDGGPATAAMLNAPGEVAVDSAGNLYIADRDNHRVRKVDASNGAITTVAGNGIAGWFFEGGPATNSSLDHPSGVDIDGAGNLYIADLLDTGNSRIQKVTADGIITHIELPVVLVGAVAIALDSGRNLYIAEEIGNRIRKIAVGSNTLTTIAGTGVPGFSGDGGPAIAAQIHAPKHLVVDSAGNIYFADSLNNRIRKVSATTGVITTVAGSGPAGFSGDGGVATAAELNNPQGVAIDSAGDVLIADTLNRRIRKVSAATGVITTIAGGECATSSTFLTSPANVAVNSSGNFIFVADDAGNRVWKVALDLTLPSPMLAAITPPDGIQGQTIAATLAGTGFVGNSIAAGIACSPSGTTVFISGTGVNVASVVVTSGTSLNATLTIAANAALGPRNITVTTDGGTSTPIQFVVKEPTAPAPTLTSIAPATQTRGSTVTVTLVGTNFDTKANGSTITADGTGISVSNVSVGSATSMTATFNISGDATLGKHNVTVNTRGGSSNALPLTVTPQGLTFVYGIPPTMNPTDQAPIQLSLADAVPNNVDGTLTLTFTPNAVVGADDPNVMFINGETSTRTVDVTFSPNDSTAQLSLPSGVLEAGTVAGTIRLATTDVQIGGVNATANGTTFDVVVPRLVPIITSLRVLNVSSAGFDVEITGYSTSRDISAATFSFGATSGANLLTVQLRPDVSTTFTTYYESPASAAVGSAFVYTQPFVIEKGTIKDVASVTVTLTNAQGTSEPKSAPLVNGAQSN